MSKKVVFPLIAVCTLAFVGPLGCHAEAKIGNAEPKAATPPPPPPPPAPEPPKPAPEPAKPPPVLKPLGKAKIENNEIKIPGKIKFDTDKATIREDADTKEILKTLVDVLKENPAITKLQIQGHTDDQGGTDHNKKLSDERANAVVEWLAKNGVDKARLAPQGYGEEKPLVKNDTAANREQNRRVEFKIWELDGKVVEQKDTTPAVSGIAAGAGKKDAAPAGSAAPASSAKPAGPAATTAAGKK